jgi:2-polyprenyl-3-methyl-5-hydroxy-6-metoxy-1,4-benzoquinol methylase
VRGNLEALRRLDLDLDDATLVELAARRMPQSRLFMADLLPHVHRLFGQAPPARCLRVLDVGAETAAGAALLAELHHPESHAYLKMDVTAIDVDRRFEPVAAGLFPDVTYRVGDVMALPTEPPWDLVVCSHVVEHVEDPETLVAHLQRLAAGGVAVVAAPFEEDPLIPEHRHRLDAARIAAWGPSEQLVYTNLNWRWYGDCFVAVFDQR